MNARTMPPTNVDFSSFFRLEPHLVLLVYNALVSELGVGGCLSVFFLSVCLSVCLHLRVCLAG